MLPQKLGDLDNPDYLTEMSEKVQKLQYYKYMLSCGSITDSEYFSLKDELLFGGYDGFLACNDIEMNEPCLAGNKDKSGELK